jgi:heat shock protein HslJ
MRYLYIVWFSALLVFCLGISACASPDRPTPLDLTTLKNLTYSGIYDEPIRLKQGYYEGNPFVPEGAARPRVWFVEPLVIIDDLDSDGVAEAAFFLTESSGGSGSYTYLAIVDSVNQQYQNVATQNIGDRIQVLALRFAQGALELDMITTGPGEAACCPTLKMHKSYGYREGNLTETTAKQLGHVSLRDLQGSWSLTHLGRNQPVPKEVKVNIEFSEDRFSGLAGCNRYFGQIKGKAPRDLAFGPIGATRMMCPAPFMQVEDSYLQALQTVEQFSFRFGQLVLSYQDDKGWHSLLFAPE